MRLTLAPFVVVAALAVVISLAGFITSPHPPSGSIVVEGSPSRTASSASPNATASSRPATQAPTSAHGSNSAGDMLRVHNALRAAIGAQPGRADDRVTAAAQHHAEYLARAGAIGHDESPGNPGFTGVTVRDRLAAQGYADATASEVAASSDTGTEDVRFLWDLPYHRLGLMHPHLAVAGWGHVAIDGRMATVGVLVFDYAAAGPDRLRSPAEGQRLSLIHI